MNSFWIAVLVCKALWSSLIVSGSVCWPYRKLQSQFFFITSDRVKPVNLQNPSLEYTIGFSIIWAFPRTNNESATKIDIQSSTDVICTVNSRILGVVIFFFILTRWNTVPLNLHSYSQCCFINFQVRSILNLSLQLFDLLTFLASWPSIYWNRWCALYLIRSINVSR